MTAQPVALPSAAPPAAPPAEALKAAPAPAPAAPPALAFPSVLPLMEQVFAPFTHAAQVMTTAALSAVRPPASPVQTPGWDDEPVGHEVFRAVDRAATALGGRLTGGLSPMARSLAFFDWAQHLAAAPGKQAELVLKAWTKAARLGGHMVRCATDPKATACISPLPGDDRFSSPAWQGWPHRIWYQSFLLQQQWLHNLTHEVPGVSAHHEAVVSFAAKQALDFFSPSNWPLTNPDVMQRTRETGGFNFVLGAMNAMEDLSRTVSHQPPVGAEKFTPGKEVAVTPGEVIYRDHLIELIQYRAATDTVQAEPVLIVPAWIMKYYILDLSPQNSLIRYLVSRGHTVFCISWRNVGAEDRDLGLEDYRRQGVMAALDAINAVVPDRKVHAVGYCLGGTLLSIAAAAMARAGDDRLASVSLFAAQTDFSEAGELQLFVDPSQLHTLESMMWSQGYLSAGQMAGAFQMLRSNDLIWSRVVHDYMMGERTPMNDLMAWNADATRMPFRMHSEYLRDFFLNNDLAAGRYVVEGHPVSLQNIRVPLFVVGTERDHVAPWKSVYKIHHLTDTDVTFLLASGGHNAGIVSEPGHPRRHFRMRHAALGDIYLGPEEWVAETAVQEGSWWPAWSDWLTTHSSPGRVGLPRIGAQGYPVLEAAPGGYVLQR